MLKAVIFDMDGVIIDSEPIHHQLEAEQFAEMGLVITEEEHDSFIGTTTKKMWTDLKEKHHVNEPVDVLVKVAKERYYNHITSQKITPIPGVVELIKDLNQNGVKIALASSGAKENVHAVLKIFQIKDYFNAVVSGDEVSEGKPAPDIFLEAAKRIGVEPDACVVVEDSTNGVNAAARAGMKSVGFNNPSSRNQNLSKANLIVVTLEELNYNRLKEICD
ncbi:MAG: HAD family phosphatase [Clostridia bacterium]|nr:HAD family phosphatase [Clostridia bacterium]